MVFGFVTSQYSGEIMGIPKRPPGGDLSPAAGSWPPWRASDGHRRCGHADSKKSLRPVSWPCRGGSERCPKLGLLSPTVARSSPPASALVPALLTRLDCYVTESRDGATP